MAESISTAPFFCFAARHPKIAALVVEAMVDLNAVAYAKLNDWWLFYPFYPLSMGAAWLVAAGVPDNLNVQQALRIRSDVPALFIHHPKDRVTPYRIARRIFNGYTGPKRWITLSRNHSWENHMTASYDLEINAEVIQFLNRYLRPR